MNLLQDDGTYHDYTFFCPDTFILIPQIITGLNNDDIDVAEVDIVDTYVLDCPVDDNRGHRTIKLRRIDSKIEVFLGTVNIGSFVVTSTGFNRDVRQSTVRTSTGFPLIRGKTYKLDGILNNGSKMRFDGDSTTSGVLLKTGENHTHYISRPLTRESSVTGLSTMAGAILVVNQKNALAGANIAYVNRDDDSTVVFEHETDSMMMLVSGIEIKMELNAMYDYVETHGQPDSSIVVYGCITKPDQPEVWVGLMDYYFGMEQCMYSPYESGFYQFDHTCHVSKLVVVCKKVYADFLTFIPAYSHINVLYPFLELDLGALDVHNHVYTAISYNASTPKISRVSIHPDDDIGQWDDTQIFTMTRLHRGPTQSTVVPLPYGIIELGGIYKCTYSLNTRVGMLHFYTVGDTIWYTFLNSEISSMTQLAFPDTSSNWYNSMSISSDFQLRSITSITAIMTANGMVHLMVLDDNGTRVLVVSYTIEVSTDNILLLPSTRNRYRSNDSPFFSLAPDDQFVNTLKLSPATILQDEVHESLSLVRAEVLPYTDRSTTLVIVATMATTGNAVHVRQYFYDEDKCIFTTSSTLSPAVVLSKLPPLSNMQIGVQELTSDQTILDQLKQYERYMCSLLLTTSSDSSDVVIIICACCSREGVQFHERTDDDQGQIQIPKYSDRQGVLMGARSDYPKSPGIRTGLGMVEFRVTKHIHSIDPLYIPTFNTGGNDGQSSFEVVMAGQYFNRPCSIIMGSDVVPASYTYSNGSAEFIKFWSKDLMHGTDTHVQFVQEHNSLDLRVYRGTILVEQYDGLELLKTFEELKMKVSQSKYIILEVLSTDEWTRDPRVFNTDVNTLSGHSQPEIRIGGDEKVMFQTSYGRKIHFHSEFRNMSIQFVADNEDVSLYIYRGQTVIETFGSLQTLTFDAMRETINDSRFVTVAWEDGNDTWSILDYDLHALDDVVEPSSIRISDDMDSGVMSGDYPADVMAIEPKMSLTFDIFGQIKELHKNDDELNILSHIVKDTSRLTLEFVHRETTMLKYMVQYTDATNRPSFVRLWNVPDGPSVQERSFYRTFNVDYNSASTDTSTCGTFELDDETREYISYDELRRRFKINKSRGATHVKLFTKNPHYVRNEDGFSVGRWARFTDQDGQWKDAQCSFETDDGMSMTFPIPKSSGFFQPMFGGPFSITLSTVDAIDNDMIKCPSWNHFGIVSCMTRSVRFIPPSAQSLVNREPNGIAYKLDGCGMSGYNGNISLNLSFDTAINAFPAWHGDYSSVLLCALTVKHPHKDSKFPNLEVGSIRLVRTNLMDKKDRSYQYFLSFHFRTQSQDNKEVFHSTSEMVELWSGEASSNRLQFSASFICNQVYDGQENNMTAAEYKEKYKDSHKRDTDEDLTIEKAEELISADDQYTYQQISCKVVIGDREADELRMYFWKDSAFRGKNTGSTETRLKVLDEKKHLQHVIPDMLTASYMPQSRHRLLNRTEAINVTDLDVLLGGWKHANTFTHDTEALYSLLFNRFVAFRSYGNGRDQPGYKSPDKLNAEHTIINGGKTHPLGHHWPTEVMHNSGIKPDFVYPDFQKFAMQTDSENSKLLLSLGSVGGYLNSFAFASDAIDSGTGLAAIYKKTRGYLKKVISHISRNDNVRFGLSRESDMGHVIEDKKYALFIVPDSVLPSPIIHDQSGSPNDDGQAKMGHIIDATALSPSFQNANHVHLVLNGKAVTSGNVEVSTPYTSSSSGTALCIGCRQTYRSADIVAPVLKTDQHNVHVTNIRLFHHALNILQLKEAAYVTDASWGSPVYFLRAYELFGNYWLDTITGTRLSVPPGLATSIYPGNKDIPELSGGYADLLTRPETDTFPLMQRMSKQRTTVMDGSLRIYTGDSYTKWVEGSSITEFVNTMYLGLAKKEFLKQTLGTPALKGYIEGPPPIPAENISITAADNVPTQCISATVVNRVKTDTKSNSRKIWSTKGQGNSSDNFFGIQAHAEIEISILAMKLLKIDGGAGKKRAYEKSGAVRNVAKKDGSGVVGLEQSEDYNISLDDKRRGSGTTTTEEVVQYSCRQNGHHELHDLFDRTNTDRPGMPFQMKMTNFGTVFAEATVMNEFVIRFNGRVIRRMSEAAKTNPTDDKGIKIEIVRPFPMDPAYRVNGCLDGSTGYRSLEPGVPFIPREMRSTFSTEQFTAGKKSSFMCPTKGAILKARVNELNKTIDDIVESGSFTRPDGASMYRSVHKKTSVSVGIARSTTGDSATSTRLQRTLKDEYKVVTERSSEAYAYHLSAMAGASALIGVAYNGSNTNEESGVTESSDTKTETSEFSSRVTNEIDMELLGDPYQMYVTIDQAYLETHKFYIGHTRRLEVTEDEDDIFNALAPFDQKIVEYYTEVERKPCLVVYTYDGYALATPDASGSLVPLPRPGTVKSYQFDTFFLAQDSEAFDVFFSTVADKMWLATDPFALQLQENREETTYVDRVVHVVNFVERNIVEDIVATGIKPSDVVLESVVHTTEIDWATMSVMPWEAIPEITNRPENLGRVLNLIASHTYLKGFLYLKTDASGTFMAALVDRGSDMAAKHRMSAEDIKNFENDTRLTIYVLEETVLTWNKSRTALSDAMLISMSSAQSLFMKSHSGLLDIVQIKESAFPQVISQSSVDLSSTLESKFRDDDGYPSIGEEKRVAISKIFYYYFQDLQERISTAFIRYELLKKQGIPDIVPVPAIAGITIRPETEDRFHSLEVLPAKKQIIVTITLGNRSLLPFAWWGICRQDQKELTTFQKWKHYGYVSHDENDQRTYNPTRFAGQSVFSFVISTADWKNWDDVYTFFIYDRHSHQFEQDAVTNKKTYLINGPQLDENYQNGQDFKPGNSNQFRDTYQPVKSFFEETNELSILRTDSTTFHLRLEILSQSISSLQLKKVDSETIVWSSDENIKLTPGVEVGSTHLMINLLELGKNVCLGADYYVLCIQYENSGFVEHKFYSAYPTYGNLDIA
jgi:hypothetical protein